MTRKAPPKKVPEFDNDYVADICQAVYRDRWEGNQEDLTDEQARKRCELYSPIVRSVLRCIKKEARFKKQKAEFDTALQNIQASKSTEEGI